MNIRSFVLPTVLSATALAGVVIVPPRAWVEHVYSNHVYAFIQPRVTWFANLFPFALSDILLIAGVLVVLTWIGLAIVRPRQHGWALLRRLMIFGSVLVLIAGIVSAGSFRRQSLRETGDFRKERIQHDALLELAHRAVRELNAAYPQLPTNWPDLTDMQAQLTPAFDQARLMTGTTWKPRLARPKHTMFDLYMRKTGFNGYFAPFFNEVVLTTNLFPFERAYVLTHEWGHTIGRADESEAAYIGWLACMHGPVWARYSAWIRIYWYIAPDLTTAERRAVSAALDPGPRADMRASVFRGARDYSRRLSRVSDAVGKRVASVSRVRPEMKEYGLVVQLILGLAPVVPE